MDELTVSWKGDMQFEANVNNIIIPLDAPQDDSPSQGVRPKPLLLVALAGCTGMDIASLSKKMRVEFKSFTIDVKAEKTESMPMVYTSFELIYRFESDIANQDKIIKMVKGSQEKYCGVSDMLRKIGPVKYTIILNGTSILSD